jgi:hypothetical protein
MKRPPIAAIALCVACAVGFEPAAALASGAIPLRAQQAAPLALTGLVLEHDGRTPVPNQRLRLRNIDTGATVGEATSDKDGAFSFPVTTAGTYVVEAVSSGGVLATSSPISSTVSPFTRNVILPLKKPIAIIFTGKGAAVIAAAATAGIVAITKFGDDDSGPVSAER